jgi:hypothetical protein
MALNALLDLPNQIRWAHTNKSGSFAPLFGDAIYAPPPKLRDFAMILSFIGNTTLNLMRRDRCRRSQAREWRCPLT